MQSARDVDLVSSQLGMQGAANLNLTGTMANPVILGRVNLTGGGVFFLGKRYEVRNGTIEFSNPVDTEPMVNLYSYQMPKAVATSGPLQAAPLITVGRVPLSRKGFSESFHR